MIQALLASWVYRPIGMCVKLGRMAIVGQSCISGAVLRTVLWYVYSVPVAETATDQYLRCEITRI